MSFSNARAPSSLQERPSKYTLGEWYGGVISALVGLPLTLGCGAMLFSGLGDDLAKHGISAALYTAIIACLISSFIGCHRLQISGPRVASTLLLADYLKSIYPQVLEEVGAADITSTMIAFMMACVILSGVFQLLFALFRLGNFIRFLPITVTQGVSTAIGLIIIGKQFPVISNYSGEDYWGDLLNAPLSVLSAPGYGWLWLVAGLVIVLLFLKPLLEWAGVGTFRWMSGMPVIAPLIGGLLFLWINEGPSTGLVIGAIDIGWPSVTAYWKVLVEAGPLLVTEGLHLILTALAIAGMGALNSLMSNRSLENVTPCQHRNSTRELLGQGLGNLVSGIAGGMPSAGSEARGMSNYGAGGRTRLSGRVHALVVFGLVFLGEDLLVLIPTAVLAALLIYTGLVMAKPMAVLLIRVRRSCASRPWREVGECVKGIVQSFLVLGVMLFTAYFYGMASAIAAGFAASACLFIFEMSTGTRYRVLTGDRHRSRRMRHVDTARHLSDRSAQIKVLELEGVIFFGTAERLRSTIEGLAATTRWLILDFRKVTVMDITGAEIISTCRKENKDNLKFYFAHLRKGDSSYQALSSVGLIGPGQGVWFDNTDQALEEVENQLLDDSGSPLPVADHALSLEEFLMARELSNEMLEELRARLTLREIPAGKHLFEQGSMADELFLLRRGSVSIRVAEAGPEMEFNGDSTLRRVTYSPGVFVGSMAFIERRTHSLRARADEGVEVYVLTREVLDKLIIENPVLGQHLLFGICRHLSWRLRVVTEEVRMLERWS